MKNIYRCTVQHTDNTKQTIQNIPGFFIAVCATVGQIVNVRSGLGGNTPGKLLSGSSPKNLECGGRKRFSLLQKVNDDAGI